MSSKLEPQTDAVLGLIPGKGIHTGVLALPREKINLSESQLYPSFLSFSTIF